MAATLSSTQIVLLASDLNAIGDSIQSVLNNPDVTLTTDQSNVLSSDLTKVNNAAANLATWAAQVSFDDASSAFTLISSATSEARSRLARLEANVSKINQALSIVASVVSLGVAVGTGDPAGILRAASSLASTASG